MDCTLYATRGYGQGVKEIIKYNTFYSQTNFYWIYGNISPRWIWYNVEFLERKLFGEVIGERIIWSLMTRYMITWIYGHKYKIMMS